MIKRFKDFSQPKSSKELIAPLKGLPLTKKREMLHKIVVENAKQLNEVFDYVCEWELASEDYGYYCGTDRERYPTTMGEVIKNIFEMADGDNDLNVDKRLDLEELYYNMDRPALVAHYRKTEPGNWYYEDMTDGPSRFSLL